MAMMRALKNHKSIVGVVLAAVVGGLGYRRYKQVKIGDRVTVSVGGSSPLLQLGVQMGTTVEAIVRGLDKTSASVSPVLGGVAAPMAVTVQLSDVVANLTPRLV